MGEADWSTTCPETPRRGARAEREQRGQRPGRAAPRATPATGRGSTASLGPAPSRIRARAPPGVRRFAGRPRGTRAGLPESGGGRVYRRQTGVRSAASPPSPRLPSGRGTPPRKAEPSGVICRKISLTVRSPSGPWRNKNGPCASPRPTRPASVVSMTITSLTWLMATVEVRTGCGSGWERKYVSSSVIFVASMLSYARGHANGCFPSPETVPFRQTSRCEHAGASARHGASGCYYGIDCVLVYGLREGNVR